MERRFIKLQKNFLGNDYPVNNSRKHSGKFCQIFIVLMAFIVMALIVKGFLSNRVLGMSLNKLLNMSPKYFISTTV